MHLQLRAIGVLVALGAVTCQTTDPPAQALPRPVLAGAPPEPGLALSNFEYQYGNAVLPGPAETSQGLSRGQVAGIVVGCLLFGVLVGALGMLCWVKRRRLFPKRFGPPTYPDQAPAVAPIDVLRTGSKLDSMTKHELGSVKSFTRTHHQSTVE